jgi:6-phosphogluconolactonase
MKLYLGTYTKKESKGIYSIELLNNELKDLKLEFNVDNPTYISRLNNDTFSVVKDGSMGGIAYYKDGKFINQVVEEGAPPCYVSYDLDRNLVFSANYHGGRVNTYKITKDGLVDHQKIVFESGSKAHYIQYNEMLDQVLVCDLGLDRVYFFSYDENNKLVLKYQFNAELKTGPRHLVVHPLKPLIYVFTELSSEVLVLELKNDLELVSKVSCLPEGVDGPKWGAAIRLSNDARYLYVSNRGHDSISVFRVSEDGVGLELVQNVSTEGVQPRDFNLSPCGKLCVVANHDTNNLTLFARCVETGMLSLLEKDVYAPECVCVIFD